ncbi:MAG: preprotein translocase subunit SecA [Clostridia bacterium]|nr:preprotein translocase subunit SecA [Clostridia bacterium]
MGLLTKLFGDYSKKEIKRIIPLQQKVLELDDKYSKMSDEELKGMTDKLKAQLESGLTVDDILPDAFAVCREASYRVLGMKHFPVQILGGIILHQGRISEMKTGEGKTLVATLPAYLNALSGKGVHIVTVNDYLARRDCEWMGKVYRFLGLSCGLIVNGLNNSERREAYNCDITYGTNNEMGFDYLRDNMVTYAENKVQRGHHFAIVDEVDSILIDEARTPLIISGQGDKATDLYEKANSFVKTLTCHRIKEINTKEEMESQTPDCDYIVDEKARSASLTARGVEKAERYFNIDNLNDIENTTISHHINQAIRAYGVMKKDIDYVVKDGEVLIVDEFTGRIMFGRRYSEGLHQAIEAKEGVSVEKESKTLATITFQNYFRLYTKLSGMTGTATTEAAEFQQIYKLDVVEIPTNLPIARKDHPDSIFKTEKGKLLCAIRQIKECNDKGQPILVGTISIEKSELISALLKREGIKHNVLNAKNHEKEAEIVAQAGKLGAVTIATNMAGRGTDIMLGGNAEYLAKAEMRKLGFEDEMIDAATSFFDTDNEDIIAARKTYSELNRKFKEQIAPEAEAVKKAGGLFILGTERHDSRRIDNQLRGRAGRQGDVGESRFYISAEDDLLRLFGGERIYAILNTMGVKEDEAIDSKMLSSALENAQKTVEGRNFAARKSVLEFDDVMNVQRGLIYEQRDKVLNGDELKPLITKMIHDTIDMQVSTHISEAEVPDNWDFEALRNYFAGWLCDENEFKYTVEELNQLETKDIKKMLCDRADALYEEREEKFGSDTMRKLERLVLLHAVDTRWMEHIDAMDDLKRGIGLRGYGQHDPVVEFRNEGYEMFNTMTEGIKEETARVILTCVVKTDAEIRREQVAKITAANVGGDGSEKKKPKVKKAAEKVGRNDPCPCGSGKKYKKCCGADE